MHASVLLYPASRNTTCVLDGSSLCRHHEQDVRVTVRWLHMLLHVGVTGLHLYAQRTLLVHAQKSGRFSLAAASCGLSPQKCKAEHGHASGAQ